MAIDPHLSDAEAAGAATGAGTSATERRWLPLAAALVTMVLWASAFVVIRALSGALDPGPLALGRLLVGSLVLTVVAVTTSRRRPRLWPHCRSLVLIIAYGVLWFGVYTIAVNAAGRYLDAGTSAMIVNLAPVIVAVLAGVFLAEGFPQQLMLGLLIAFAGVVIIGSATRTGAVDPRGVVLALVAAGLYAVGVLLQKQALATVDPVTVTWLGALAGAVATLPFLPRLVEQLQTQPLAVTAGVVYLGVFPTAIAFLLWTYALARTSAGRMAASSYLVPGIAVLLSWALLGEVPALVALIGGAVSLAGVALTEYPGGVRPRASARAAGYRDRQGDDRDSAQGQHGDVESSTADLKQPGLAGGQRTADHGADQQGGADDQATDPPGLVAEHGDHQAGRHADDDDQQRTHPQAPTDRTADPGHRRFPQPAATASARSTTLVSSMARVIGPTPPGIGAIQDATSWTEPSRSPANPASVRVIPTSTQTAPGFTISPVTSPGRPAAATTMPAVRVWEPRSTVPV